MVLLVVDRTNDSRLPARSDKPSDQRICRRTLAKPIKNILGGRNSVRGVRPPVASRGMTLEITTTAPLLASSPDALAAADAVATQLADGSAERERAGTSLTPQLQLVADAGLLGISVPPEHGGPGLPASTIVEVLRRLSRGDGAVGQLLLSHFVVAQAISGLGQPGSGAAHLRRRVGGRSDRQCHRRTRYQDGAGSADHGDPARGRDVGAQRHEVLRDGRVGGDVDRGGRRRGGRSEACRATIGRSEACRATIDDARRDRDGVRPARPARRDTGFGQVVGIRSARYRQR